MIPGRYKDTFVNYIGQLKNDTGNERFLKNWNARAKKRIQNLGVKKVELMRR